MTSEILSQAHQTNVDESESDENKFDQIDESNEVVEVRALVEVHNLEGNDANENVVKNVDEKVDTKIDEKVFDVKIDEPSSSEVKKCEETEKEAKK